jgi:clan AA aspartic protease (TIGR02281 family)
MKKLLLILLCFPMIGLGQCVPPNGCENGEATYTYPSGNKYVGEWKDEEQNGQGTYTYANGNKYVGEFKNGMRNGQGTYTSANGNKYVGEWKDGDFHGQGTYTWANGNKYVGKYKDGKKNGLGTCTYGKGEWEGDEYVGEWKENLEHGQGTYTWANGLIWSGEWERRKQKEGYYNTENYYNVEDIFGDNLSSEIRLRYSNNRYKITLNISGIEEDFLFDTGATDTQINDKLLNQLKKAGAKIKILKLETDITYGSGNVIPGRYAIIDNIAIGDYILNNVVVLVGKNQSSSLLLGIGTLNKFKDWSVSKNGLLRIFK